MKNNSEIFLLRSKPELKIIFNDKSFEVTDKATADNNGVYLYRQIKSIKINPKRTNWFISVLSHLLDLLTDSGIGGKFKDQANLKINLNDKTLKFTLIEADLAICDKVYKSLLKKI